jgi:hypothetical protein
MACCEIMAGAVIGLAALPSQFTDAAMMVV